MEFLQNRIIHRFPPIYNLSLQDGGAPAENSDSGNAEAPAGDDAVDASGNGDTAATNSYANQVFGDIANGAEDDSHAERDASEQ